MMNLFFIAKLYQLIIKKFNLQKYKLDKPFFISITIPVE